MSLTERQRANLDLYNDVATKRRANEALDKDLTLKSAHATLSSSELNAWINCRYTGKVTTNYDKLFVIFNYEEEMPQVLAAVRILEMDVSQVSGFSLQLAVEIGGVPTSEFSIGHEPVPIFEDKIFCHIPHIVTAFYTPHFATGKFVLRLPMVYKSQAKPWDGGAGVRMMTLPEFKADHPEMKYLAI